MREEVLPENFAAWREKQDNRPQVYVALGTFLSHRSDVLIGIGKALRKVGARAAIAIGSMPKNELGPIPDDWLVARELPQVAMLQYADLAIHHGGNNSVQECLAAGIRQLVLPFSTDQFANAADLARVGVASVLAPNEMTIAALAEAVVARLDAPLPTVQPVKTQADIIQLLFE